MEIVKSYDNGYNSQIIIATESQKLFEITNGGSYLRGMGLMEVFIAGQSVPFKETHSEAITLETPAKQGDIVELVWYEGILHPKVVGTKDIGKVVDEKLEKGMVSKKPIVIQTDDGANVVQVKNAAGDLIGQIGKVTNRMIISNLIVGSTFEMFDDGYIQVYAPTGNAAFYLDDGNLSVNDRNVAVLHSGNKANRPKTRPVGYCYFDTSISKPIWWTSGGWVDATGTVVT